MKKIGLMIAAFVAAHLVLAWLFWAHGYNFEKRDGVFGLFALLGTSFGALAAVVTKLIYEEKQ